MTAAEQLRERYAAELRGFGSSLPEDFGAAAAELAPRFSAQQLELWAQAGVALANYSLRSWEASAEYFRASPQVASAMRFEQLMAWARIATELAERSSVVSAAFLKATPEVLEHLPPWQLEPWARQGERLCRGNWKSIALCALYFSSSPRLLAAMSLQRLGELVAVVDALTERSYELATTCVEHAPQIFGALAPRDHEPFLRFAQAVTRVSWADTRLYLERGPALLERVEPEMRSRFLELAARVTADVGRQGFPLFAGAAAALGEIELSQHDAMLAFAGRLAIASPIAAMEYLKSAPFVRTRLTAEQMQQWAESGASVLLEDGNAEGAEAFFRLESTRAEQLMTALTARVELAHVGSTLRLYAKALTGEQVSVRSTEELVERGIGWVTESSATTEGTAIYLPPFISTFEHQDANFQAYKVFATHQAGRMEFGSFRYRFGDDGTQTPSTVHERERRVRGDAPTRATTAMERYFDLFPDRALIAALFTVIEDTRVDAYVGREYGGIRSVLRRLQAHEAQHRPALQGMALRAAFVENLLRASLQAADTMQWPHALEPVLRDGLSALRMVELAEATVQDSAEVAAALYDIAQRIPNVELEPDEQWETPDGDLLEVAASMPGGGAGDVPMPQGEEAEFETPPQPEFRGDFKPELVQLLMQLRQQREGDGEGEGAGSPITQQQLQELLEKSVELSLSGMEEGDIASSLAMFLSGLEKEGGTPQGEPRPEHGQQQGSGEEPVQQDLPVAIEWFHYDEWDFRAADYRPRWCRVGERVAPEGSLDFYQETLQRHHGLVAETRRQFELLRPETFRKIKRLEDGEDLDLDHAIEFLVDKRAGVGPQARIYWRRNKIERDVAVAFLLDMSASTDEEIEKQRPRRNEREDGFDDDPRKYFQWLAQRRAKQAQEPPKRIIDLEKESAVLIVEALEAIGDAYGIYGFSGYGRENVEFYTIKNLDEHFSDRVRKRIAKIDPVRSTRMGPAIRHTVHKLEGFEAKVKILILVSDGRPQDHGYGRDRTEKEYAVHDTKQALLEAKRAGITPFLITVDKEGHDYLGEMCDDIGYEVVADIESLPRRLPSLYRTLATQ
ncbi:MAG: VWA domain-containing protein [Dehalococcoidia bacterium]|nr:VWA domain-containing protein [Dehalococcoidia bacterium]